MYWNILWSGLSKVKEDFNANQMENKTSSEYRTAFNMSQGNKKDVKRHSNEITENIVRIRELERNRQSWNRKKEIKLG